MADKEVKKVRKARAVRSKLIIFQVLDADGTAIPFNKDQLNIISVTTDAKVALDIMDDGQYPNATYKKVD